MDGTRALDCFFGLASDCSDLAQVFSELRAKQAPALPAVGGEHAVDVIAKMAREAVEAVDGRVEPKRSDEARAPFVKALLTAAISATKSDQVLDYVQLKQIAGNISELGDLDDVRSLVRNEINRPMMIDHLDRRRWTRTELVEIYAASRLATGIGDGRSREYLKMLAARLGLEKAMTDHIEATIANKGQ